MVSLVDSVYPVGLFCTIRRGFILIEGKHVAQTEGAFGVFVDRKESPTSIVTVTVTMTVAVSPVPHEHVW